MTYPATRQLLFLYVFTICPDTQASSNTLSASFCVRLDRSWVPKAESYSDMTSKSVSLSL